MMCTDEDRGCDEGCDLTMAMKSQRGDRSEGRPGLYGGAIGDKKLYSCSAVQEQVVRRSDLMT